MRSVLFTLLIPLACIGQPETVFNKVPFNNGRILFEKIVTVKSDIGLISNRKLSISSERRNALLELNMKYSVWLNFLLYTETLGDHSNPEYFARSQADKANQYFHDFLLAEAKFNVYLNGEKHLIEQVRKLKSQTLELKKQFHVSLIEIALPSHLIKLAKEMPDEKKKQEHLVNAYNELYVALDKHNEKSLAIFNEILPLHHSLVTSISERITRE